MDPARPDRILEDWDSVTNQARRPNVPPRGVTVRSGLPGMGLAGVGLAAVALVAAVVWLGGRGPGGVGGIPPTTVPTDSPTPIATPVASVEPTPAPTPTSSARSTPTLAPTPTPSLTPIGPCDRAKLAARITMWEGAAGNRIGDVELTNAGPISCTVPVMERPQLVDGHGSVLIDGTKPTDTGTLTVAPGEVLKTLVDDSNYCGPDPAPPVSIAFVFTDGSRIVATPLSPADVTVPPCNGAAGSAGNIAMQAWTK